MKSVSINKQSLNKVNLELANESILTYHKSRIKFKVEKNTFSLTLPPYLAIAIFNQQIIPQDKNTKFSVEVSGKKIGNYKLAEISYPAQTPFADVSLRMMKF